MICGMFRLSYSCLRFLRHFYLNNLLSSNIITMYGKDLIYMDSERETKRKQISEIMKQLSWLSQLGLSLIMPLLLCVLGCAFLCNRFDIGGWIFIPGFFFGLGASFTTGYKFYVSEKHKSGKESKKRKRGFNSHI